MKQDAVNTFSEGLNYDFNSTTTPNNVLTDCINGTFLTFNGDELALQNDAGNTTIKYLETDVHLTPGFYPLGIKEYGGVLYIISGKYPTNVVVEYDPLITYNIGDIVYTTILDVNYYFECLIPNDGTLPTSTISTEDWLYIGIEKDFINAYGQIEFGSYPSPEIIDASLFDTSTAFEIINEPATVAELFKLDLYAPRIVNTSIFRAGVYVNFLKIVDSPLNTDNISYEAFTYDVTNKVATKNPASFKNIYKVKLYHQLTNGFIDLTDNVWEQFAEYVGSPNNDGENLNMSGTPRFWFNDSYFNYHCPHNFKGKLAMSVELENLDKFSLSSLRVDYTNPNYEVHFALNYENTTQWNQGITPNTCTVYYTTDGSDPNTQEVVLTTTVLTGQTIPEFHIDFPGINNVGKTMRYKIIPDFYFDGVEISKSNFPQQFLDTHTIVGSQVITSEMAGVKFIARTDNSCEVGNTGYRIADYLDLVNNNDENLNNNLDPAGNDVYQFYRYDNVTPVTPATHSLGTYTIGAAGLAELNTEGPIMLNSNIRDYVISLLEATPVKVYDITCATVTLTVNVNNRYGLTIPVAVIQGSESLLGTAVSATQFTFNITPNVPYTVRPAAGLNGIIDDHYYTATTSVSKEITYGLVMDLSAYNTTYDGGVTYYDYIVVSAPIGTVNTAASNYTLELIAEAPDYYNFNTEKVIIEGGQGDTITPDGYTRLTVNPTYTIEFTAAAISSTYVNLATAIYIDDPTGRATIFLPTYTI